METLHHCDNDALLVDDLLDFSNGDIGGLCEGGDDCLATVSGNVNDILCSQKPAHHSSEATGLRSSEESIKAAEPLYSPPDELEDIEWLSSFVDDSYTADTSLLPLSLNFAEDCERSESQWGGRGDSEWYQSHWFKSKDEWERPCYNKNDCEGLRSTSSLSLVKEANPFIETPSISASYESSHSKTNNCSSWGKPTLLKGRTRSKRSRSGGRIWSLHMLVPFSNRINKRPAHHDFEDAKEEEEEEEEEDDLYSQVSSLDYEPYSLSNKHNKKAKKSPSSSSSSMAADDGAQQGRRCSHCQVQKTPQWRVGPLGPKTLCNACGVRYKSGRLVAEYRPAASPTFVTEIHSNSHKKILEMRLYKSRFGEPEEEALNTQMLEEESTCSEESTTSYHHP